MPSSTSTATVNLAEQLAARGISRRGFLRFCAAMAGTLAMPPAFAHDIVHGLQNAPRIPIIWLEAQDCAGNSEALLRAEKPTVAEILLDTISLDYHHLLMAPSGSRTDENIAAAMASKDGYIAIVEGSIPLGEGGIYCTVGGRTFAEMAREICSKALGVIAVGSCAWDGGIPAARGGQTGAVGVSSWLGDAKVKVINLPGCPMNPDNLSALIVQYLSTKTWSPVDPLGRPLFAYGATVHSTCESLPHFRAKEFVRAWGDEGHRKGWCLYQMGCKGPDTNANCPTIKFNGGTSWPVSSGHGCVGCTTPRFWDHMVPFYDVGGSKNLAAPTPVTYETPVPSTPIRTTPQPGGGEATPSTPGNTATDPNGVAPGPSHRRGVLPHWRLRRRPCWVRGGAHLPQRRVAEPLRSRLRRAPNYSDLSFEEFVADPLAGWVEHVVGLRDEQGRLQRQLPRSVQESAAALSEEAEVELSVARAPWPPELLMKPGA